MNIKDLSASAAKQILVLALGLLIHGAVHADDFTAEWRLNVLRGYSTRSVSLPSGMSGKQKVRVYFLDPGIVLQEILVR